MDQLNQDSALPRIARKKKQTNLSLSLTPCFLSLTHYYSLSLSLLHTTSSPSALSPSLPPSTPSTFLGLSFPHSASLITIARFTHRSTHPLHLFQLPCSITCIWSERLKMLSAPAKSAKRISSLFSLGNANNNNNNSSKDPSPSPQSPGFPKPTDQPRRDRRRSLSRIALRHVSAPNLDQSSPRTDNYALENPLPPPPSLLSVNQDLAGNTNNSPDSRPQSRGRRRTLVRPASSHSLAVPGSTGGDSGMSTPSKRRSWMLPGRNRASSMDTRLPPSSPKLPGAWIAGLDQKIVYDLDPLSKGEQVCGQYG